MSGKQHLPPYTYCPVCGAELDKTHRPSAALYALRFYFLSQFQPLHGRDSG